MISKLRWRLRQWLESIWAPVIGFAILGNLTALVALVVRPWMPAEFGVQIGVEAIDQILNILATSMLGVTTFSVSIMVTAFASAATGATPRSLALLQSDRHTRYVLAIFVGAFIYSLVGIIGLKAGLYGHGGRLILFAVTVGVLAVIIVALMRWIAHLTVFGRLVDTMDRVERAARAAMKDRLEHPHLGGHKLIGPIPSEADLILSVRTGYVQHVDMPGLSELANDCELTLYLDALPGNFVHERSVLFAVAGLPDDDADRAKLISRLRGSFSVGKQRDFDQDPRFGVLTLSEIASRALSPAINDPGTAIDVLGRLVRLLTVWSNAGTEPDEVSYPSLHVRPIGAEEFISDGFGPIARDGAAIIEVQVRLQQMLNALATLSPEVFGLAATKMARRAALMAEAALALEEDRAVVRTLATEVSKSAGSLPAHSDRPAS